MPLVPQDQIHISLVVRFFPVEYGQLSVRPENPTGGATVAGVIGRVDFDSWAERLAAVLRDVGVQLARQPAGGNGPLVVGCQREAFTRRLVDVPHWRKGFRPR